MFESSILLLGLMGSLNPMSQEERVAAPMGELPEEVRVLGITREAAATMKPGRLRTRRRVEVPVERFDRPPVDPAPLPRCWPEGREEGDEARYEDPRDIYGESTRATVDRALRFAADAVGKGGKGGDDDDHPEAGAWVPWMAGIEDFQGNHRSGRARCSQYAYDPAQGMLTLYLGTMGGGLWKYDWGVGVWHPISQRMPGIPSVGAFRVHERNADDIVIATGDRMRYSGSGIYWTDDGGRSWHPSILPIAPNWSDRILYGAMDPDVVIAATSSGLVRSSDRGRRFFLVRAGDFTDLVRDPGTPGRWLAVQAGVGLYESTDDGRNWSLLGANGGAGVNWSNASRVALAICEAAPNVLYCLCSTAGGALHGIFRSTDGARNWASIETQDFIGWGQGFHTCALNVHPDDPARVFVGMGGFQFTENALSATPTWNRFQQPGHADYTSLTPIPRAWTPNKSDRWLLCTNDGGYCTYDSVSGKFYNEGNLRGLNLAQIVDVPHGLHSSLWDPDVAIAGTQDNGVLRIDQGARSHGEFQWGGDGGQVVLPRHNAGDVFASIGGPPFGRYKDVGVNRVVGVNDTLGDLSPAPTLIPDQGFGSPLMFTHDHQGWLYYGDQHRFRGWKAVNARALPLAAQSVDQGADFDLVFYVSALYSGRVFVLDSSIHGRLGSMGHVERTPPVAGPASDGHVSADRYTYRVAYYTTGYSRPSQCFLTQDRGKTWSDATGNLDSTATFWELIGTDGFEQLYLATSVGVYESSNGGATWRPFMTGLPEVVDVRSIELVKQHGTQFLRIGTKGAGFWTRKL